MENLENEIWKDVKGYEGFYQISNLGRIRSLDVVVNHNYGGKAVKKGKLKIPTLDKNGYFIVCLYKNKQIKKTTLHRIIALNFIVNPENKRTVNHINGIKTDNRIENLEWATHKENTEHAYLNNLSQKGSKHYKSVLTEIEVLEIRRDYKKHVVTMPMLAKKYNCTVANINMIIRNKSFKNI